MNENSKWWILVLSISLAAAGFIVPLWPLSLTGLILAGIGGRFAAALAIGIVLDIAYGAPVGHWHFLYVPFTLVAGVTIVLRYYLADYFRESDSTHL